MVLDTYERRKIQEIFYREVLRIEAFPYPPYMNKVIILLAP